MDQRQFGIGAGLPGERKCDDPVERGFGRRRERIDEHRPQCLLGVEGGAVGVAGASAIERRLEREREQFALVGEVVDQGAGRPSGLGGNFTQRGAVDSGAGDHPRGRLGEFAAALIGVDELRH